MPTKQEIEARRRHFAMLERKSRLKTSEYCRAWRERKIAEGLCLQCGKRPHAEGVRLCQPCREKHNARRANMTAAQRERAEQTRRGTYARKKALGICVQCGRNNALPGLILCNDCRLWKNQSRSGFFEHSLKWSAKERKAGRGLGR